MKLYTLILLLLCSAFAYGSDKQKSPIVSRWKRKSTSPNTSHKAAIPVKTTVNPLYSETTVSKKSLDRKSCGLEKSSKQASVMVSQPIEETVVHLHDHITLVGEYVISVKRLTYCGSARPIETSENVELFEWEF